MADSALTRFNYGTVNENVLNWWSKTLPSLSTLDLSGLVPFIRLTPVTVIDSTIVDHAKAVYIDFSSQQQHRNNLRAKYGLKQLQLDVLGDAGSIYRIELEFDIYDLSVLETSDTDVSLAELARLNSIIKVEFGWGAYSWEPNTQYTNINDVGSHYGKGFELFGVVTFADPSIDQEITTLNIKLTSVGNPIMNDFKLDTLFDLNPELLTKVSPNSFVAKKVFLDAAAGRETEGDNTIVTSAVSLRKLFDEFSKSIKQNVQILGLTKLEIPTIITTNPIQEKANMFPAIQDKVGLSGEKPVNGYTVGDLMITIESLQQIKNESSSPKNFINGVCEFINQALYGQINLQAHALPPSGQIIEIINIASVDKPADSDSTPIGDNIQSGIDNYLPLRFSVGNTIIKSMRFPSDLSESGKNIQQAVELGTVQGSTPDEIRDFISTWYDPSPEKIKEIEDKTNGFPKSVVEEIVRLNPSLKEKGQLSKMWDEMRTIVKNMKIADNAIKYMPYKLEASLLGISDIWWGTRVYINEECPIPWFRKSIWRITNLSHTLVPGSWTTTINGVCEYNPFTEKLAKKDI